MVDHFYVQTVTELRDPQADVIVRTIRRGIRRANRKNGLLLRALAHAVEAQPEFHREPVRAVRRARAQRVAQRGRAGGDARFVPVRGDAQPVEAARRGRPDERGRATRGQVLPPACEPWRKGKDC